MKFFTTMQRVGVHINPVLVGLIVIVALSVLAMDANPFKGQTVAPLDILIHQKGWASIDQVKKVVHPERTDVIDARLPSWLQLKSQIRSGESPLWNPTKVGGVQGIQSLSTGALSPAFLVFILIEDNGTAYYLAGLINLVIAGFGTYLLLYYFLPMLSSIFGGMVYMLSGYGAAWFFFPHMMTLIWIPWLLWSVFRWSDNKNYNNWLLIVLFSILLIAGGFPAISAFGFYAFSLLVLVLTIISTQKFSTKIKEFFLPFFAVLMAFVITSPLINSLYQTLSSINLSYRDGGGTILRFPEDLSLFVEPGRLMVEKSAYIGWLPVIFAIYSPAIFVNWKSEFSKSQTAVLYFLLLLIVSIGFAYGVFQHELIRLFPVFNANPWNRLLVISCLAIAVLSAFGFNEIYKLIINRGQSIWWLCAFFTFIIFSYQIYEQKKVFNRYNAVVSSDWFYPETKSIKHVKDNIQPLQSIIADDSYRISGTLSAYGLSEWFAHSVKTDEEKYYLSKLVSDPFVSPIGTASFPLNKVRLLSPYMNAFSVKYILANKSELDRYDLKIEKSQGRITDQRPAPPMPKNNLQQKLIIDKPIEMFAFEVLMATYGGVISQGEVCLDVKNINNSTIMNSSCVQAKDIHDNSYVAFSFVEPVKLNPGNYLITFNTENFRTGERVTLWTTKLTSGKSNLAYNGKDTQYSSMYRILGGKKVTNYLRNWRVHTLEKNIVVLENKHIKSGAYYIESLNEKPENISYEGIYAVRQSSDEIRIKYNGESGWVVLPVRPSRGWIVYVNGEKSKLGKYLDIFSAIQVNGPANIVFRYEHQMLNILIYISVIIIVVLLTSYMYFNVTNSRAIEK